MGGGGNSLEKAKKEKNSANAKNRIDSKNRETYCDNDIRD